MIRYFALLTILAVLLAGCATSNIATQPIYEVQRSQSPKLNTTEVKELGETLVTALCSRQTDSWRISEFGVGEDDQELSLSSKATAYKYPSQVLKPRGRTSDGMAVFVATIGSEGLPPYRTPANVNGSLFNSFCEKDHKLHFLCNSLSSTPFVEVAEQLGIDGWVERAKYVDVSYPSLQQELIYNGRVDNDIKFVYRELATQSSGGALMRSPFQQDVQYDFDESDVIGFKGARLKIMEATNRQITYEVLQHFPIECAAQ